MPASRRHFQGAPGHLLTPDIGQVGQATLRQVFARQRARGKLVAGEVIGQCQQAFSRHDVEPVASPCGLGARGFGTDQPQIAGLRGDGGRQYAADMGQAPVEAEFAQGQIAIERILRNGPDGRHQPQRNGQVIVTAFLGQVGRRQVDGDALGRQTKPRGHQGSPDTLAGFLDGLVGQADQDELWKAGRDLHLHIDRHTLDALKRHCRYAGDTIPNAPKPGPSLAKPAASNKNVKRTDYDLLTTLFATLVNLIRR